MEILAGSALAAHKIAMETLATLPELQPMPPSNVVVAPEAHPRDSHSIVPADPFVPDSFGADPLSANPVQNELAIAHPLTPPDELQPILGFCKQVHEWLETVKTHRSPQRIGWCNTKATNILVAAGVILLLVISGWVDAGPATQAAPQQQPRLSQS